MVIGRWHGKTVGEIIAVLKRWPGEVTTATLPSGEPLPDPACWVLREKAESVDTLAAKPEHWAPADVLLVVEVSEETLLGRPGRRGEHLRGRRMVGLLAGHQGCDLGAHRAQPGGISHQNRIPTRRPAADPVPRDRHSG